MDRHFFAACGALAIAGITASAAQTPPPPATEPTVLGTAVTVTGCVKPWSGPATSGTGAATTPPAVTTPITAPPEFVLTDVEDKATGTAASAPSAAASRGKSEVHDQYLLRAEAPSVNLAQHVNHKVEVTGRKSAAVEPSQGAATATPASMGSTGAGSPGTGAPAPSMSRPMGAAGNPPTVTVTAIKMIAATCR